MKTYLKKLINSLFWILDKCNKQAYIKTYPKYLQWLGIQIDTDNGDSWFSPTVFFDSTDYAAISLGRNCTLSFDVVILVHDYSINNAKRYQNKRAEHDKHDMIVSRVSIGDNCFIGARAIILPGSKIENNCIIGSGSVVRGLVAEGSVVAGNPARVVSSLERLSEKYEGSSLVVKDRR
ncbi:MAG: acyltransferase [Gordonibacter sp.]